MIKIKGKLKDIIALLVICVMFIGLLIPASQAIDIKYIKGCDKGPSYTEVIPVKKTTLVQFDKDTILDDYAYLAAVPTAVFNHDGKLFSHPLLYYEDEYEYEEDKERSLNARQGLDYFMEDWEEYCGDKFDQMTLINVPKDKVDQWSAKDYVVIDGDSPYEIASTLALQDWSYSDDAVIAVIEDEYEKPDGIITGETTGTIPKYDADHRTYKMQLPAIGIGGTYHSFDINDNNYKYIIVKMTWKDRTDWDLQLFDDQLGMVQAAMKDFKSSFPYSEVAASFIHNYGKWEISISAVPKKGLSEPMGKMESMFYESAIEPTSLFQKNKIDVKVDLYPGTVVDLIGSPFGCREVEITLKWKDPGVRLGFTVLDPIGNEITSSVSENELLAGKIQGDETKEVTLKLDRLGECHEGENYSVCVFALDDVSSPIDFTVEHSWLQNFSIKEGDCFASATNGAVLASALNTPLLYTSPSSLSDITEDVLYKLGVENVYLVNLGGHLSGDVREEIKEIADIKGNYQDPKQVYDAIRDITDQNDIIFTTIDPWDYWYFNERKSGGTYLGALHIGPATYIAAHHGSPVIIVDIHPELSQAIVYPTDWWRKNAIDRGNEPSSGSMLMAGRRAYDFIEEYGFGKIEEGLAVSQDQEVIITVAGQYDIGISWDRSFVGAALSGRFWGSPVDSAYAICRNVFYPAMIFVNPGMEKVKLWQGSESEAKTGLKGLLARFQEPRGVNLVITRPLQEIEFEYPVLQTYVTYQYFFNSEASEHWDFKYSRADGVIPYEEPSPDDIDDGAAITKAGKYYPDQSESEVIPFYATKAGYSNCFSTNFDYITENLNRGVLIWVNNAHGGFDLGGGVELWDSKNPYVYEENPWRAYEPVMWKLGHLRTYLHWLPYYYYEFLKLGGINIPILQKLASLRPIKFQLFPEIGSTANPDVATLNPQLILINKLWKPIKTPIYMHDLWGPFGVMLYRDRILHPLKTLQEDLPFINWYEGDGKVTCSPQSGSTIVGIHSNGIEFDDALENLHSCCINTVSCSPANTYLHLTWMRHGTTYQIIDPWTTTDYSSSWQQLMLKRYALGDTVGEAYERGMRACGQELLVGQWWWDIWENVCLYGDPNLRVYVPDTEYSDENHWEKPDTLSYDRELNLHGHMPYGATSYPHEKEPVTLLEQYLWVIIIAVIIIILLIIAAATTAKRKRTKKK